jgi:dephospho-CoA kinase
VLGDVVLKIGLTGGIGCGKSVVADFFVKLGVPVIDTDQISRQLTASGGLAIPALRQVFGGGVICADGALNRVKMRELMLMDVDAKKALEAVLHPMIREDVTRQLSGFAAAVMYCVIDVPLLFESGEWRSRVDRVLVVDCDVHTQVARVVARSGWCVEQVERVIALQVSRETRLALADDVLDNQGDLLNVAQQVEQFHAKYLALVMNDV